VILITDLKIIKTHDKDKYRPSVHPLHHYGPTPVLGVYDDGHEFCEVTEEMVRGERFVNTKGVEVVIGWDKQTQEYLGLPFRVFESMEKRRQSDYEENTRLRKKLRELEGLTLWQLLRKKIIATWRG